ncbi:GFA family protein [Oleiagrimonas citrea]|uniref:GFA family protein n=1 Tax=Oleiagrimonas citrea TaxID=1665687 RepID=A0A846ZNW2_9GAMM|nr:GFA family protein [Oleiagrimonas citrea]NKZ39955.1 GFA family protein [Oleiagrimonas citrea]
MHVYRGHCLCGAVAYVARSEPVNPHYCHCDACRRSAGAPVVAWVNFAERHFAWEGAEPKWFASSPGMRRGFCGRCGSTLCTIEDDGYACVAIGSLDYPEAVAPQYDIYVQHTLPWLKQDDGLRREEREDRF